MSENEEREERFEKMPDKKKQDQSNDWLAACIMGLILVLGIVSSPTTKSKTKQNDSIQNTEQTNTIINTPDTQLVEQNASVFDTTFLFFKRMYEKNR